MFAALRQVLLSVGLLAWALTAWAQNSVRNEQVQVTLLAHAPQGVQAGQTFWLGLKIEHAPHWHTYWQNPGDSGLPTRLQWQLPAGLKAGELAWPLPKKIPIGDLANYGYEHTVLLAVPVTVSADFQAPASGSVAMAVQAEWLVCRQECIPQEAQLRLDLPAHSASALHGSLFDEARARTPTPVPAITGAPQSHSAHIEAQAQHVALRIHNLPVAWRGQTLALFPITEGVVHNAARQGAEWTQEWNGAVWQARVPVSHERSNGPNHMQWVLALGSENAPQAPALQVSTPVQGAWPALAAAASVSPELARALEERANTTAAPASDPARSSAGLVLALLGALVGGLILNLMPCVFPVLAIKLLSLARPDADRRTLRNSALAYTVGTVASFVLLGTVMLALRAAGEQLGWGFQLQSPALVMALVLLFALLGLNLAGLFEVGHILPASWAAWQSRHPALEALLSGMLAVAVASPCTAPFMGAALGLAVSLPATQALLIFATMGLGMALPFALVSLWPTLARRIPRSGAWMQTLRQALAFPMFATAVWLLWVLGQQTGIDTVAATLVAVLLLTLAAWGAGLRGRTRAGVWIVTTLLSWALWQHWPQASAPTSAAPDTASSAGARPNAAWQAWSEATVQRELAAGRTVFVDFTAAWCVTCQFNKNTVLAQPELLAAFERRQVLTLRADWTRKDARITAAINALGRNGVPVYAVYAPGRAPVVLSELPSVQEIVQALP